MVVPSNPSTISLHDGTLEVNNLQTQHNQSIETQSMHPGVSTLPQESTENQGSDTPYHIHANDIQHSCEATDKPYPDQAFFRGYQIAATLHQQHIKIFIDSGSTTNYISEDLASRCNLNISGPQTALLLADQTTRYTAGEVSDVELCTGDTTIVVNMHVYLVYAMMSCWVYPGLDWINQTLIGLQVK